MTYPAKRWKLEEMEIEKRGNKLSRGSRKWDVNE